MQIDSGTLLNSYKPLKPRRKSKCKSQFREHTIVSIKTRVLLKQNDSLYDKMAVLEISVRSTVNSRISPIHKYERHKFVGDNFRVPGEKKWL